MLGLFGLMALGLILVMVITLVKNALLGKQLSKEDTFFSPIDVIIPFTAKSFCPIEAWKNSIIELQKALPQVRIHVLFDGPNNFLNPWEDIKSQSNNVEIHNFPMRPSHVEPVSWMLDQLSSKIQGQVVIIGDPEVVPQSPAFSSIAKNVTEKKRNYFVLPQTAKQSILTEALSVLSPNLVLISFLGFQKWNRYLTHPLLGLSQGWIALGLKDFQEIDFKSVRLSNWKEALSRQWSTEKKKYYLAFGEKFLVRHYPETTRELYLKMKNDWKDLWLKRDRSGFWTYIGAVILWSYPLLCLTHPIWFMTSFSLLVLFRFFSKIVFQESWKAVLLHPLACVALIGSFFWFLYEKATGKKA